MNPMIKDQGEGFFQGVRPHILILFTALREYLVTAVRDRTLCHSGACFLTRASDQQAEISKEGSYLLMCFTSNNALTDQWS